MPATMMSCQIFWNAANFLAVPSRAGLFGRDYRHRAESGEAASLTLSLPVPGGHSSRTSSSRFPRPPIPCTLTNHGTCTGSPRPAPIPEFDGELTVRADETYETSQLELRGNYRPPGGALGAAFDWALGGHIATQRRRPCWSASAPEMESRHAADEQAKAAGRRENDDAPLVGTLRFVLVMGIVLASCGWRCTRCLRVRW